MGIKKEKIGLFLSSFGAVIFALSLLIGLYNFGLSSLTLIPAICAFVVMCIGTFLSKKFWTTRFNKKNSQYSILSGAYIILAVFLILSLNFILNRKDYRFDLSEQNVNTLSEQSQSILSSLEKKIRINVFLEKNDPRLPRIEGLAHLYEGESPNIYFRFLSPKFDVQEVRKYHYTEDSPPFIAEMNWDEEKSKRELRFRIQMKDLNLEQIVTNAVIRLKANKARQVVIIGGHGELDPMDKSLKGLSQASKLLKDEGYQMVPLNLFAAQQLPSEVSLVVIAGVKSPFLAPEKQLLLEYLRNGGHVLLMLEAEKKHGLDQILTEFGVLANQDIILDVSPFAKMYGERTAISLEFAAHIITQKFKNTMCLFPGARSLSLDKSQSGVSQVEILKTGEKSWGESNFQALSEGEAEWELGESKGPVTLAVAGEKQWNKGKSPKSSRFVIVGDSDFIANENLMQGANRNFFLNSVAWLSDIEENITVRPRIRGHNQIILTPKQRKGIQFLVIQLLPSLILALGIGLYFSRKEQ